MSASDDPPMPASRARRRAMGVRVRTDITELLGKFARDLDVRQQDAVDMALLEFLNRRGYWLPGQKKTD